MLTACPLVVARLSIAVSAAAAATALGPIHLTRAEATLLAPAVVTQGPKAGNPAEPRCRRAGVPPCRLSRPIRESRSRTPMSASGSPSVDEWRKTDAEGRLDIVHTTGPSDRHFSIDVWGDGQAMQRHQLGE